MEIRHLKMFLAVSEAGSFSRAAAVISVPQPVLSRQVKSLEEELGVELFYRNGRGVILTDAGRLLAGHAEVAVSTVARATDELRVLREAPTGSVVIGVPPTVGTLLTLPVVRRFRADFPQVALRIVEGFSGFVLEWLSVGRVDVAVIYNAPKLSTLLTEELYDEELFLIGPAADPTTPGAHETIDAVALSQLSLVLPSPRHGLRILIDNWLGQHRLSARVDVEADSLSSILTLVEDGLGYSVLPYAPVNSLIAAGRLRFWRIANPGMVRRLVLATSTSRISTPATRASARIVRDQVRALVESGAWSPPASMTWPSSSCPRSP